MLKAWTMPLILSMIGETVKMLEIQREHLSWVRVKGGMSLGHCMWYDLRNGLIMQNVIIRHR